MRLPAFIAVASARFGRPPGNCSREQERGQAPPSGQGGLVGRPPGLEELQELLARLVLLPTAVRTEDVKELVGRRRAVARSGEHEGEVEAGLEVGRIGLDAAAERAGIAERCGLL